MSLRLLDSQKVRLSIAPLDAAGQPATIDGLPVWTSTDESVVSLEVAVDGMSVEAIATGPVGNAQVSVSVDADLGSGVRTLTATLDIEVVGGEAVTLSIAAGTPEAK